MCGIIPFVKTLYDDLRDAIDDLFPKSSTDTAPLMNNRQSFQLAQPHQKAYASAPRPVAENRHRAAERWEIRATTRLPSPPRDPPTR
ncbi:hypothetical protein FSARC_5356 [Fusarium sarcochroum]|uniref:Uncharacterized protein n=1 Tax=Fusarium sarcochroum TaxID=1208366 RepID=A0A8H4TZL9_9HYPO|nr:hypothetical protein FSARC_5356 [Fusarium sarcochroum]